jgi:hypothetical protein
VTSRAYELRTYHAAPGRRDDLETRFRDHTLGFFADHDIRVEGFFRPSDEGADYSLVYLLSYDDREAGTRQWAAFQADPRWQQAKAKSEENGPLVASIESVFLEPTDYSPLQ